MANRGHEIVKVEDSAEGLITYKNSVRYGFYCMNNYGADEPICIKLLCEKGKAEFNYDDAYIRYNDGTTEEAHQDENSVNYEGGKDYWGFGISVKSSNFTRRAWAKSRLKSAGKKHSKRRRSSAKSIVKGE